MSSYSSLSTYSSYLIVSRDMNTSISRVASQNVVARDTEYYKENISKVSTVDEFLDDYRLYSYAMKAYGLEDMTFAKAFIKKVLESDLTDSSSFANSLNDSRYAEFASAYNFGGQTEMAQTSFQTDSLLGAYEESFEAEEDSIQSAINVYARKITTVSDVDDLVGDADMRKYVLNAFGLDATYTSKSYLKQVLTSDLDDPASVANQATNDAWRELAAAFNFNTDGTITTGESAQSDEDINSLRLNYVYNMSTYPSDLLYSANQEYWENNIASVTSASELVADERLLGYVKTAFDLRDTMMASSVASLMYSQTFADTIGNTALLDFFNFESDGTLTTGADVVDADKLTTLSSMYKTAFQADQNAAVEEATTNFETRIANVTSIEDFLTTNADYFDNDDDDTNNGLYDDVTEIWDVALRAYGIDPDEVSMSELKKILASDLEDKDSYVNKLDDERYVNLVKAFNFDANGDIEVPLTAQSEIVMNDLANSYTNIKTMFLEGTELDDAEEAATEEIEYFQGKITSITTVEELLSDDRLMAFILESRGLDPEDYEPEELKKIFTSDLDDADSYVNQLGDPTLISLVGSFNFDAEGNISTDPVGTVQQRGDVLETVYNYYRQSLEEDQGNDSQGIRLALYFQRQADSIESPYDILGDSALLEFFTTAFNLSDYFSSQDLEQQAASVEKFIELEKLRDPDYVESLIQRFTALYDVNNSGGTSPALSILTSSSSVVGISADTLEAVAQLSAK